jgi:hypothetical protein
VIGQVGETETEPLRFDSFENNPLYHYAPARENARIMLDKTITENPLGWTIAQLRIKLPAMLQRAGYDTLAGYPTIAAQLDHDVLASALRELEAKIPPMMPAAHG